MKLVGMMSVRNEAWCLWLTLRAALLWCDEVVCADHGSTDASREIMESVARQTNRVIVREDREGEWREMKQREMLLREARDRGATHLAIIDADELLTANLHGQIRDLVAAASKSIILHLPGYYLRGGMTQYHANGIWGTRWFSTAFLDNPALGWRGDTFHQREPMGMKLHGWRPIQQGHGGVLHLWGTSERRLRAKHALYKMTERLRWPTKSLQLIEHEYNLWRSPADAMAMYPDAREWAKPWVFASVPASWLTGYDLSQLNIDAEPWQEAECRRLRARHGEPVFAGLDLLGVV